MEEKNLIYTEQKAIKFSINCDQLSIIKTDISKLIEYSMEEVYLHQRSLID